MQAGWGKCSAALWLGAWGLRGCECAYQVTLFSCGKLARSCPGLQRRVSAGSPRPAPLSPRSLGALRTPWKECLLPAFGLGSSRSRLGDTLFLHAPCWQCQVLARHRSSPSCCPWDLPGRPRVSAYLQEQWGHSAAPGDSDRGSAWWARVPQRRWTPKSVNCHPAPSLLASCTSLCPTGLPPAPQSSSTPPWAASRLCTLSRASSGPRRRGPSVGLEP